jgi:hypothetical protein
MRFAKAANVASSYSAALADVRTASRTRSMKSPSVTGLFAVPTSCIASGSNRSWWRA